MRVRSAAAVTGTLVGLSALFLPATAAATTTTADTTRATAAAGQHKTVVVAHRGASAYAPENTLAAVDAADRLGFAWVENDVQRTKDGELVIMHDPTLARTTDVERVFPGRAPWNVSDFTLEEIEKLDAGSWFSAKYAGERVPTLEDYMDAVEDNGQKLLMEIKKPELYPGIERQTLRELRRQGWLDRQHVKRRLVIQSFSADSVKKVHALRSDIKTGFLGTPDVADLPAYAKFADQINPNHTTIDAGYIAAVKKVRGAHGRPLEAYAWTVDSGPRALQVARMGVTGIISNKPDVVRDALRDAK